MLIVSSDGDPHERLDALGTFVAGLEDRAASNPGKRKVRLRQLLVGIVAREEEIEIES